MENENTQEENMINHEALNKIEELELELELAKDKIKELECIQNEVTPNDMSEAKIEKLLGLLSLEDESVKHIKGGYMQKLLVSEYYKAFPKK